jgi:hypothetical protein
MDNDASSKKLGEAMAEVLTEYHLARERFGPFNSAHEGYAVLLEEVQELWDTVRLKGFTIKERRDEARQVAAIAIAFMLECAPTPSVGCGTSTGRPDAR